MNKDKDTVSPTVPRFASQWDENKPLCGQVFTEPSMTVPDQSLTIPEIIAKYTRTGQVPGSFRFQDKGGNVAADPGSDPLDDYTAAQAAAAAAKAAEAARVKGPAGGAEKKLPSGGASENGGVGEPGES